MKTPYFALNMVLRVFFVVDVDISVLTSFSRMQKLTTDTKLIARALKNSSIVEVRKMFNFITIRCCLIWELIT